MIDRDAVALVCLQGLTTSVVNVNEVDVLMAEELADKAYLLAEAMVRRSLGCWCEVGPLTCGVPGVLCLMENGEMKSVPERCDCCRRFLSDEGATRALKAHLKTKRFE